MKTEDNDQSFLGSGWAYPIRLNDKGEILLVNDEEDIKQAIYIILGTSPGERMMRPDFGAGLKDFIFDPINTTTMTLIQHRVEEALINWEPRINLVSVKVTTETFQRDRLLIDIQYKIRSTNTDYNLVYPFYLAEGLRS